MSNTTCKKHTIKEGINFKEVEEGMEDWLITELNIKYVKKWVTLQAYAILGSMQKLHLANNLKICKGINPQIKVAQLQQNTRNQSDESRIQQQNSENITREANIQNKD